MIELSVFDINEQYGHNHNPAFVIALRKKVSSLKCVQVLRLQIERSLHI